jgi:hypothetical protein
LFAPRFIASKIRKSIRTGQLLPTGDALGDCTMPPVTTDKSAQHHARDLALFDLVLRHRVILREVADRFLESNSGHILRRHCEEGALATEARAYPGNITGYRATAKTCALMGAAKDRARALRGSALNMAIALNVFCWLEEHGRLPLYHAETKELLGSSAPAPAVSHVASEELGFPSIFRVFHAADVDLSKTLDTVRRRIHDARMHPTLSAWQESGEYGLAVLAPTSKKRDAILRALSKSGHAGQASIIVGLGPTVETLHATLLEIRRARP